MVKNISTQFIVEMDGICQAVIKINFDFVGRNSEKKLSEMSLEELWMMFPIYLTEH